MRAEPVSFREIMPELERRFKERLHKARIFPDLLQGCLPAARRLKWFQDLRRVGAELYLLDKMEGTYGVLPTDPKYLRVYALCSRLRFPTFAVERQVFTDAMTSYMGKGVAVYLGEWEPFIPFRGDPLRISWREFTGVVEDVRRYMAGLKRRGVRLDSDLKLNLNLRGVRDDNPVFLTDGIRDEFMTEHRFLGFVSEFAEYSRAYTAYTEEMRRLEMERVMAEKEREEDEARRAEALFAAGVRREIAPPPYEITVSEVGAEALEDIFGIRVVEVARRVLVYRARQQRIFDAVRVGISIPTALLHALRYLQAAGLTASLVRPPSWLRFDLGLRVGIRVKDLHLCNGYDYHVIVLPKRLSELPPIPLAKVFRSGRRIVVVS